MITVALVIGYLPSLYAAYSDRERRLMTLDAGAPRGHWSIDSTVRSRSADDGVERVGRFG